MQLIIDDISSETPDRLLAAANFLTALAGKQSNLAYPAAPAPISAAGASAPTPVAPPPAAPVTDEDDTSNDSPPDVDAKGFAWDGRIHSSSKALNKDGTWRYMRGADKAEIDRVEAELRGAPPVPPAAAADAPPPPPAPIPAEALPVPPAPPSVNGGSLFKRLNDLKKAGKLDEATVQTALDTVGLASMADLLKSKDSALFAQLSEVIDSLAGEA